MFWRLESDFEAMFLCGWKDLIGRPEVVAWVKMLAKRRWLLGPCLMRWPPCSFHACL